MNFRLRAYSLQDIGLRTNQQDCFYPPFKEPCEFSEIERDMVWYDGVPHTDDRLFILCDGMGGHDFGEVASQIVTYKMSRSLLHSSTIEGDFDDSLIQKAVEEAHEALKNSKEGSPNMGTTMTVLKFHADGATIGHIGDSRVYQFRPATETEPARIVFCTKDHNVPGRPHVLSRAIMAYSDKVPEAEIDDINDIREGDIFVLCSDGITDEMTDEELCSIMTNPNYGDAERVERLLLACEDHPDNHTAIIVRVKDIINEENLLNEELPLSVGTLLQGSDYSYHIEKVLGKGSFGITYLANVHIEMKGQLGSIQSAVQVALKEFAVEGKMKRVGSELQVTSDKEFVNYFADKFRQEVKELAILSHPNIVRILEVFEANNTIYYSMEYLPDGNLADYACIRTGLPEKEAIGYIRQMGSALSYIHSCKMLHLDIKPDNVMRQGKSTAKLIDFGIAKRIGKTEISEKDSGTGIGTAGFAPPEQVDKNSQTELTPAADVYALGASYYKLLVAFTPNNAQDVAKNGLNLQPLQAKGISKKSIDAIVAAMQPDVSKRLQTVDEFLAMLPSVDKNEDFAIEKTKSGFPWKIILVILAFTLGFVLLNVLF